MSTKGIVRKGKTVESVPLSFDEPAYAGRWFKWEDVSRTFGPGSNRRAAGWNPMLDPIGNLGGVYCLAESSRAPRQVGPKAREVTYIGETANFRERLREFGYSAGCWGKRRKLHHAGWNWPEVKSGTLRVSFHSVGYGLAPHLADGMRCWLEALALDLYRELHGEFPKCNRKERKQRNASPTGQEN